MPDEPERRTTRDRGAIGGWLRFSLAVGAFAGGAWITHHFHLLQKLPALLDWFRSLGPGGAAAFVGAYVLACVFFLPGSPLTLGAGALFGVPLGFALVSLASTLGAAASFLIGRFVARGWIARKAAGNAKFGAIDAAIGHEGWKIVVLLRLSPLFPFSLLNYALGLTRVKFRDYLLASWLGMMPGTLLYVWVGALAGDAARLANGQRQRGPAEWALYGVGLLATVAVTLYVARLAKLALYRHLTAEPEKP
ncbi:MAG TPA: TVP38/TMEM64 family protein [Candidatus Limnocylindria bacterium]|nr:TVP38/TMEM64 family protein [Candidatus Limnocylindria bacterium]